MEHGYLRSDTSLTGLLRASADRGLAAREAWRVRFYRKSDGTLNRIMLSPELDMISQLPLKSTMLVRDVQLVALL